MNLNQLTYFQAVCHWGSVSRAAEVLHISQPSVSGAVKALEEEFQVILFERKYRGMALTEAGEKLYTLSRTLTESAGRIERIMQELGQKQRTVRIGIPPMIGALLLPKLIKNFFLIHPEIQLEIIEKGRLELLRLLDKGALDLAIVAHEENVAANYQSFLITIMETGCIVHTADRLARKKQVCAEDFRQHRVVMFPDGYEHAMLIRRRFEEAGITPDLLVQTSQLSTILALVKSNLAAGFLFREMKPELDNIVYLPFDRPIHVRVSLLWKKEVSHFAEMDEVIAYVKKTHLEV